MKKLNVAAAIIQHNDKFLCVQRGQHKLPYIANKWEFPGGKIEIDETPQQAIVREINEELKMDITPIKTITTVLHSYPDFIIQMQGFLCTCTSPDFTLTEHIDSTWLSKEELDSLDWASADIPIVKELMRH